MHFKSINNIIHKQFSEIFAQVLAPTTHSTMKIQQIVVRFVPALFHIDGDSLLCEGITFLSQFKELKLIQNHKSFQNLDICQQNYV